MIRRINISGNPNLGVIVAVTEENALIPPGLSDSMVETIEESLQVETVSTPICGSNLAGALACGNSNGFVVSQYAYEKELEILKAAGLKVKRIPDKFTAIGNIVLANDYGALVHPLLSEKSMNLIRKVLKVEVEKGSIAQFKITGSVAAATNKGVLLHPQASEEDIKHVERVLQVPADVGTVNNGLYMIGACTLANSKGVMVGLDTTGPELARIEEAFGFLEGYL